MHTWYAYSGGRNRIIEESPLFAGILFSFIVQYAERVEI